VGASGCGKSTLLNIIAGLEHPDTGQVLTDGKPVTEPGRDRMVMFQEAALFPWLDVTGNVMFGLKLKPNLSNSERREVARFYIKLVGLERFASSNIHELSGGMKQRVALARALAPNPRVLLIDEPFSGLDAVAKLALYLELQRIHQETRKTIIFVTHEMQEAACLGDRILVFSGSPGRVMHEMRIDLPRPREFDDPNVVRFATELMVKLKQNTQEPAR
jgi:NitT/TauT family transport system ATP-binding protein